MNLFKPLTKVKNILQGQSNRNRAVLHVCRELEFPLPSIRSALVKLNTIELQETAGDVVSVATLSNALHGRRHKGPQAKVARKLLADSLGLNVEELF